MISPACLCCQVAPVWGGLLVNTSVTSVLVSQSRPIFYDCNVSYQPNPFYEKSLKKKKDVNCSCVWLMWELWIFVSCEKWSYLRQSSVFYVLVVRITGKKTKQKNKLIWIKDECCAPGSVTFHLWHVSVSVREEWMWCGLKIKEEKCRAQRKIPVFCYTETEQENTGLFFFHSYIVPGRLSLGPTTSSTQSEGNQPVRPFTVPSQYPPSPTLNTETERQTTVVNWWIHCLRTVHVIIYLYLCFEFTLINQLQQHFT